ncbi:YfhO family protein [Verrucomicrobiota bacterium]
MNRFSSYKYEILLFLTGSLLLSLFLVLLEPSVINSIDYAEMHSLNKFFFKEQLLHGNVPLWNPYITLGRPFLADIETACFYPPNLLFAAFPEKLALIISHTLHFFLASFFMMMLARSWEVRRFWAIITGFVFLLCGPVIGRVYAGLLQYVYTMCYWPLLFWLAWRLNESLVLRRWLILVGILTLQFLCGHPQFFWITCLGISLFFIGYGLEKPFAENLVRTSRKLLVFVMAIAASLALSAVQLFPFLELIKESNRAGQSLAYSAAFAMPWREWMSLLIFNTSHFIANWENYIYPGLLFTMAGIFGLSRLSDRRMRGLLFMAVVCVLIALGECTPVFRVLYHVVPGLSSFRIPARTATLVTFSLILASGCFLSDKNIVKRMRIAAISLACVFVAVIVFYYFKNPAMIDDDNICLVAGLLVAIATLLIFVLHLFKESSTHPWSTWVKGLTCGFVLAELCFAGYVTGIAYGVFNFSRTDTKLKWFIQEEGLFKENDFPVRVAFGRALIKANSGMKHKYGNFSGYVSLVPDRVWVYIHDALDIPVPQLFTTFPDPRIYDHGAFPFNTMNLMVGHDQVARKAVINPDPDPRAYLVYHYDEVDHWRDAIVRMKEGHNVHDQALIEKEYLPIEKIVASRNSGTVDLVEFRNERVELAVTADVSAILVLAETWFPGWTAVVNGKPADCFPVNVWMRGVVVPAGESRVVFRYSSTYLGMGALVSLAVLLAGICLWRLSRAKQELG